MPPYPGSSTALPVVPVPDPSALLLPLLLPPPCQACGRGSDGARRILDITPTQLHQRLPLFLGSPDDIAELESYGDVQQTGTKKYNV